MARDRFYWLNWPKPSDDDVDAMGSLARIMICRGVHFVFVLYVFFGGAWNECHRYGPLFVRSQQT